MKRQVLTRRDFLGLLAGAAGCGVIARRKADQEARLTVLHTNDVHSRIDPFPAGKGTMSGWGGVARRASLIRRERQRNPTLLLLDAGDAFEGTPYFNLYHGEVEIKAMSMLGYDAMTLGNHDFDHGVESLCEVLSKFANFDIVSSNYDFGETPLKGLVKRYTVRQFGEIRVGIFGLGITFKDLVTERNCAGVAYRDPIEAARKTVRTLRSREGARIVVCLSHLGLTGFQKEPGDRDLARQVPGIDFVVGGHTHTFMEAPEDGEAPDGWITSIFQVGWGGLYVGKVDFTISKGGRIRQDAVMMGVRSRKEITLSHRGG